MFVSFACFNVRYDPEAQVTSSARCPELRHVEKLLNGGVDLRS